MIACMPASAPSFVGAKWQYIYPCIPHLTVNGVLENESERGGRVYFHILFFIDKIWQLVENAIGVRTSRWIMSCSLLKSEIG